MKILCVIDSLGSGGAQRQLVTLAVGFKEKGHYVSFLIYHKQNFFKYLLDEAKIAVHAVIEPNYFKRLLKMRKYIRKGNYDAVLSFLDAANFICEVSGFPFRKWKLVVGERSANPGILKSPKLIIFKWFHIFADYIVSNSYANLKIVLSANPILSKSKCKLLYNIVSFDPLESSLEYIPRKDDKLKLIVIASHLFVKNLNGLIDALSLLSSSERNKLSIDWYGDRLTQPFFDNSFPEAKQKIKQLKLENLIMFYPATKQIAQKIQEADAIGLFSFYEGLPNIVCEGMACAKPILCSKVSDIPELLSYDKNLLFDSSDPQSIKKTLSYFISLSKDRLIQIGIENEKISKKRFKKEIIVTNYLKLFAK